MIINKMFNWFNLDINIHQHGISQDLDCGEKHWCTSGEDWKRVIHKLGLIQSK